MRNTAFKLALALHASYLNRLDLASSQKPTTCNVPDLYVKYPEIFEAFAWEIHCKCRRRCVFEVQEAPPYNRSAYNIYAKVRVNGSS